MDSKLWDDVNEGDSLPTLDFPITIKTLVLAVCGTRDLMPYHHNSPYTKSIGSRDMFLNTMFEQALFGRFVTDWCGPDSDFRRTSLQMVGQLVPGDIATIDGAVTRKYRDGDDYRVDIDMTAANALGLAAKSSATIAMPSREGGRAKPLREFAKPAAQANSDMPDFAKEWLGQVSPPSWGAYPISEVQIMYWCDMVEDANPLYAEGEYARSSRHGGVIAPPMGLITWMAGRAGRGGINPEAPDVDYPDRKPWPPLTGEERSVRGRRGYDPPGAKDTIATISVQEYGVPLRPGDRVYSTGEVINCSPLKRTALGFGYFVTTLTTFYNQRDEIAGTNVFTLLRYGVPEEMAKEQLERQGAARS